MKMRPTEKSTNVEKLRPVGKYGWRDLEIKTEILPSKELHRQRSADTKAQILGWKAARRLGPRKKPAEGYQLQNYLWQEGS